MWINSRGSPHGLQFLFFLVSLPSPPSSTLSIKNISLFCTSMQYTLSVNGTIEGTRASMANGLRPHPYQYQFLWAQVSLTSVRHFTTLDSFLIEKHVGKDHSTLKGASYIHKGRCLSTSIKNAGVRMSLAKQTYYYLSWYTESKAGFTYMLQIVYQCY